MPQKIAPTNPWMTPITALIGLVTMARTGIIEAKLHFPSRNRVHLYALSKFEFMLTIDLISINVNKFDRACQSLKITNSFISWLKNSVNCKTQSAP
jgi:hypothetical protein